MLHVERPSDPPQFFATWQEYLKFWDDAGEPSLCQVLAANNEAILAAAYREFQQNRLLQRAVAGDAADDLDDHTEEDRIRDRVGTPWVTPVIGPGCLSLPEGPGTGLVELVPAAAAAAAVGWGSLPDGTRKDDLVRRYAATLLERKLGVVGTGRPAGAPARSEADLGLAARALLCASLLTRLYHEVGALTEAPPGAWSTPVRFDVRLDGPTPRGAEIQDALVAPLLVELRLLQRSMSERPGALSFVEKFAEAVRADLTDDEPQVRGSDAMLMSEIAWHFMTEGTPHYPGWSDLVVLLHFTFDSADRRHRWPHLTSLARARKQLADELHRTTDTSWRSRATGQPGTDAQSVRDQLYDAVADLLVAQAGQGGAARDFHTDGAPPAVAYVTSFDLELEMALLAKGVTFRLVMPFYVRSSEVDPTTTGYVWLHTVVVPGPVDDSGLPDLDCVYRPRRWSLLTSSSQEADLSGIPTVVRIAGSPLVQAPDLRSDDEWAVELRRRLGSPKALVDGTVLLDEHTALHQWAADMASPPIATASASDRLALPERFVSGSKGDTHFRFWFLIGVQLGDDAVRQRVAAIVGAAELRAVRPLKESAERPARPRRAGVCVNRRTTPRQRDVLHWQGIDVVQGRYEELLPALRHAAAHAARPVPRRMHNDRCPLGEDPA